jgi:hypothetical protein
VLTATVPPDAPVWLSLEPTRYTRVDDADGLAVSIENRTNFTVTLDWDRTTFVDDTGRARRVIHRGVRWAERNGPQAATALPPRARVDEELFPADSLRWIPEPSSASGGAWHRFRFLPVAEDGAQGTYAVVLGLVVDGRATTVHVPLALDSVTLEPEDR